MPADIERLVRDKLRLYAAEPAALANNVKALKGKAALPPPIGDWLPCFTVEADRLIVHDVGPRGSIYG